MEVNDSMVQIVAVVAMATLGIVAFIKGQGEAAIACIGIIGGFLGTGIAIKKTLSSGSVENEVAQVAEDTTSADDVTPEQVTTPADTQNKTAAQDTQSTPTVLSDAQLTQLADLVAVNIQANQNQNTGTTPNTATTQ